MEDNVYYVVLTIASLIVYLVVAIAIANRIKKSKAQRKYKDELNIKISTARTAELYTNQCQDEYDCCIRVNNKQIQTSREKEKTSQELQNHAVMLRQQASDIDSMLKQHYSIGIIPPDYRDMIRVLYIQRAYRNDQVDTMREATLLCDRDVYHIEIKNGLSEIADAIKSLSSTLSEINWNITRMNSELRDIANGQERIITETESARYATEAVQKSQESLLWYEQQKWYRSNS